MCVSTICTPWYWLLADHWRNFWIHSHHDEISQKLFANCVSTEWAFISQIAKDFLQKSLYFKTGRAAVCSNYLHFKSSNKRIVHHVVCPNVQLFLCYVFQFSMKFHKCNIIRLSDKEYLFPGFLKIFVLKNRIFCTLCLKVRNF